MTFGLRLITPPAVEPVTTEFAKQHLRVESTFTDDDALIGAYIVAARQYVETSTRRAIYNQTWVMSLDAFPWLSYATGTAPTGVRADTLYANYWRGMEIKLPKPSLVSVTSISYLDSAGNPVTVPQSMYYVDPVGEPGRIVPVTGSFWASAPQYMPGSVQITYVAGTYGDGVQINTCPQTVVMAILLLVAHWYEHRESVSELNLKAVPMAVDSLLAPEVFTSFSLEAN